MCEALRELMKDEIEEEKRKAVGDATKKLKETAAKELEEARRKAEEAHIKSLMKNMKWTAEKAMAALNIPAAEWADYAARL